MQSSETISCPDCKGTNIRKAGMFPSKTNPKQRYRCFDCGRTFFPGVTSPVRVTSVTGVLCPFCKDGKIRKAGFQIHGGRKYQRYQCLNSGSERFGSYWKGEEVN